ncbi:MAG TPA: biotin/lipoyl-binding protein [Sphingobacteriaceae bacterium]|nr:biotin/lipoyl-binding protein [Sphingobacteriaceae bacterium]
MNIRRNLSLSLAVIALAITSCQHKTEKQTEGKIKRESISVTTKIPGRIEKLLVKEGDLARKGDTLAILEIPEVNAKLAQAQGAVRSAEAQYDMAENGATANQLQQLQAKYDALKEQYEFAQKSFDRVSAMFADSLISPQNYDEASAKYQGAKAQFNAVNAELNEAKGGARYENRQMALGQKERAGGALEEAKVAYNERYITAPVDMSIETIALHQGELATPGYAIFNGYLPESTWFRVTLPESQIGMVTQGENVEIFIPYAKKSIKGTISIIKQLSNYANITTAYPDYQMEEALYEIKIIPTNSTEAEDLLNNASIILKK